MGGGKTMITYICGTNGIHYKAFPEGFWDEFYSLLRDGDEILLGDSDFDHRIYNRCRIRQYDNFSVMRLGGYERHYPIARIGYAFPAYVKMLEKCDRMTAVWDGISEEVFINMLMLLALNKKCKLFYMPSGTIVEIQSLDDLKPYVKECERWSKEDIREVLRKCGFSEEMIAFNTVDCDYSENEIAEIICKAPLSLKAKCDMMQNFHINGINYDTYIKTKELLERGASFELIKQTICDAISDIGLRFDDCCAAIRSAEYDLEYPGFQDEARAYCLFDEWYDPDMFIVKSAHVGVFDSLKNVMKYIKLKEQIENESDGEESEEDYSYATWYRLEVWDIYDKEMQKPRYDYYIYNREVCWFEKLCPVKEKNGYKYYSSINSHQEFLGGLRDLNMPTPYKPGDIVNIDCRPFGPPFHAMITEAHNQYDCCMPQILFKMPYTDKWRLEALKHKRFYKDAELTSYEPALSPLYRIRMVKEDELKKDDELLIKISKELDGDEGKARAFWKAFNHNDGMDSEDVLEVWDSCVNKLVSSEGEQRNDRYGKTCS